MSVAKIKTIADWLLMLKDKYEGIKLEYNALLRQRADPISSLASVVNSISTVESEH